MNCTLNVVLNCEKCGKKMDTKKTTATCKNDDCEMRGIKYSRPTIKIRLAQ